MKVACMLSGGKDSVYSAYLAKQMGWDIEFCTVYPQPESMMFHHPNIKLVEKIADLCNVKLTTIESTGDEMEDLRILFSKLDVDGIMSGAILSDYQKHRIDMVCEELGLRSFTPLWRKDSEILLRDMTQVMNIIMVSVSADGLDESWLGRKLDMETSEKLKSMNIHPMGEGGEFETLVVDCPLYDSALEAKTIETVWDGVSGHIVLE